MFLNIIEIATLCIVIGGASIPPSFAINSNPFVVWGGNALGSLLSAIVVIYIGNRMTNKKFESKMSKKRFSKKIVTVFEQGEDNKKVKKASIMINRHGLKLFSLVCPIFPGVLIATVVVFALDLDKDLYKRWMSAGVVLVSGFYVFSYWWFFVK